MRIEKIDLYGYFGVKKPENAVGELICYLPEKSEEINKFRKSPAMLVLPGGAYVMTSFREDEPVALKYVAYGFSAFVLRYSVVPLKHPVQLTEAVMAMIYLRKNAETLGIDENMISAIGFSAGGHLCAMLGSHYDASEVKEVISSPFSARPNAIILGYPVITASGRTHEWTFNNLCGDDEKLKQKLSIENLVNKNSSPAFIWATCNDGAVPVRNSLVVASAYEEVGVPFSLHVYGNGRHGLSTADKAVYGFELPPMTEGVEEWVALSVVWLKEQGIYIKD